MFYLRGIKRELSDVGNGDFSKLNIRRIVPILQFWLFHNLVQLMYVPSQLVIFACNSYFALALSMHGK